jgi:hypothetical protein
MHFLMRDSIDRDVEHHRWEKSGDRGRREQNLADQTNGLRAFVLGDGADVPDYRNTRIEICRDDHKRAATPGLLGNSRHQVCVNIFRD